MSEIDVDKILEAMKSSQGRTTETQRIRDSIFSDMRVWEELASLVCSAVDVRQRKDLPMGDALLMTVAASGFLLGIRTMQIALGYMSAIEKERFVQAIIATFDRRLSDQDRLAILDEVRRRVIDGGILNAKR